MPAAPRDARSGPDPIVNVSRKLVIGNAVYDAGGLLLVQLITFFILPLFIKNLGAELYGVWVLSGILLGYLDFFDFGLTAGLQKYIADAHVKKDHRALSETVCSGLGFLMLVGLGVGVAIILFRAELAGVFNVSAAHRREAEWILVLTGVASILNWPLRVGPVILSATLHIKSLSVYRTGYTLLSSLLMLGMVAFLPDIVWIRVVTLVLQLAYQLGTFVMGSRLVSGLEYRVSLFRGSRIRGMFSFSLGMFVFQVLGMLSNQIQPVLISMVISPASVAYYTIASKIFTLVTRLTSTLNQTILPTAFNLSAAGDVRRLEILIERGVRYRMMLAGPLGVLCIVVSEPFIRLWVGESYVQYAGWSQVMGILILATPLAIAQHVARACSHLAVINRLFLGRTLAGLAFTVAALPSIGIGAAVLGLILSNVLLGDLVFYRLYCRLSGVDSFPSYLGFFKMSLCMVLFALAGLWAVKLCPVHHWPGLIGFSGAALLAQYGVLFGLFVKQTERHDLALVLQSVGLGRRKGTAPPSDEP